MIKDELGQLSVQTLSQEPPWESLHLQTSLQGDGHSHALRRWETLKTPQYGNQLRRQHLTCSNSQRFDVWKDLIDIQLLINI